MSRLKQSYFRVYEFNSGIDKRYEMWKSGRLPLTSHADSIPRLTKQERESLRLYFKLMTHIYLSHPTDSDKPNPIVKKLTDFSQQVLRDYINKNEQYYSIREKISKVKQTPEEEMAESSFSDHDLLNELGKMIQSISNIIAGTILEFFSTSMREESALVEMNQLFLDITVVENLEVRYANKKVLERIF